MDRLECCETLLAVTKELARLVIENLREQLADRDILIRELRKENERLTKKVNRSVGPLGLEDFDSLL